MIACFTLRLGFASPSIGFSFSGLDSKPGIKALQSAAVLATMSITSISTFDVSYNEFESSDFFEKNQTRKVAIVGEMKLCVYF